MSSRRHNPLTPRRSNSLPKILEFESRWGEEEQQSTMASDNNSAAAAELSSSAPSRFHHHHHLVAHQHHHHNFPNNIEGFVLFRKRRFASWKRRYAVLQMTDNSNISSSSNHGGNSSNHSSNSSNNNTSSIIGAEQHQQRHHHQQPSFCLYHCNRSTKNDKLALRIPPDVSWHAVDVEHSSSFFMLEITGVTDEEFLKMGESEENEVSSHLDIDTVSAFPNADDDGSELSFMNSTRLMMDSHHHSQHAHDTTRFRQQQQQQQQQEDQQRQQQQQQQQLDPKHHAETRKIRRLLLKCPMNSQGKQFWMTAFAQINRMSMPSVSSLSTTASYSPPTTTEETTTTATITAAAPPMEPVASLSPQSEKKRIRFRAMSRESPMAESLITTTTPTNAADPSSPSASSSTSLLSTRNGTHYPKCLRESISVKKLSAHDEAEFLSRRKRSGKNIDDERFLVQPDYAYRHRKFNREELRREMVKPSETFHDLRIPTRFGEEIGTLRVEVLQCFGLPKLDIMGETDAHCVLVCGSYAFNTDIIPSNANPMWLAKMRRACLFPIFHAYAKLYVGVLDDDGKKERDDFAGRVVLDLARLRPHCTYDVTLPLRLSGHVYSKRRRGAVRLRLHLSWVSERAALLSYFPSFFGGRRKPVGAGGGSSPSVTTVQCSDEKAFQNVVATVQGEHMSGKFSMKKLKAVIREINFTRIILIRVILKTQIRDTMSWKNPFISLFVFCAWMHCVYANSVALLPGHVLTFLWIHLWRNYARFGIDGRAQRGFLPPTWEEMFAALWTGGPDSSSNNTKQPCIEPMDMRPKENQYEVQPSDQLRDVEHGGISLQEIANEFKKGVKVKNHRFHLKHYRDSFIGRDAVDFLMASGLAFDRRDAVKLGRKLIRKLNLFHHVTRSHDFEDGYFFYRFSSNDDPENYMLISHEPWGKDALKRLGFYTDSDDDYLEFPFANGSDYPKFTVKESLVIRAKKDNRDAVLREEDEEKEFAASVEPSGGSRRNNGSNLSDNSKLFESHDSFQEMSETKLPIAAASDVEDDVDDTDDNSSAVMSVNTSGEFSTTAATATTTTELPPPPNQNIDVITKQDKKVTDVLLEAKEKVHGSMLNLFNDQVYLINKRNSITPPTPSARHSSSRKNARSGGSSSRGIKGLRDRKRELDKWLSAGSYSHQNPAIAKLGLFVEPILGIAIALLSLCRAVFNVFTWRDPMLTFWVSLTIPFLIVILHVFPWRMFMLVVGILAVGPQNWVLRLLRERRGDRLGKNNETVAKQQKGPSPQDEMMEYSEDQPMFRLHSLETRNMDRTVVNPDHVGYAVVPNSPLIYRRFYDWPPEPQYARVKADKASDRGFDQQEESPYYLSSSGSSLPPPREQSDSSLLPSGDMTSGSGSYLLSRKKSWCFKAESTTTGTTGNPDPGEEDIREVKKVRGGGGLVSMVRNRLQKRRYSS